MRMTRFVSVGCGFSLGLASAIGAAINIPHTFSPGQQARSSQVNENFSALAAAIDNLSSTVASQGSAISALLSKPNPIVVKDANGVVLGSYLGNAGASTTAVNLAPFVGIRTPQGYVYYAMTFENSSTSIAGTVAGSDTSAIYGDLFFLTSNCTGQAYTINVNDFAASQGFVFALSSGQNFYVPADARPVDFAIFRSSLNGSSECVTDSTVPPRAYPVQPNDPSITGAPNGSIARPLKLGI